MTDWVSVLVASVLGSLHCVGMCGGLVGFYAASDGRSHWSPHLAYHLARLLGYGVLGAVAGQLGSALDGLGARVGFGQLGVLIAVSTLGAAGLPPLLRRRAAGELTALRRGPRGVGLLSRLQRAFAALAQRASQRPPLWRASALGLTAALLPCGWLYAFVALAMGTGSALGGAGLLFAFWVGTVPALLGFGVGLQRAAAPLRARLPRLSAVLVALACGVNVASRWPAAHAADPASASTASSCHHAH